MSTLRSAVVVLISLLVILSASFANATVDRYSTAAGSLLQVAATRDDTGALVFSDTLIFDLGMAGGFVDYDPTGVPSVFGTGTIEDFGFFLPASGPFAITNFGLYDEVYIDSGAITPDLGFGTLFNLSGAIQAGPLKSAVTYSANDLDGPAPPVSGVTLEVATAPLSGQLSFPAGNVNLVLSGFVLGTFNGAAFGEGTINPATGLSDVNVNITGTLNWTGELVSVIPEPSTGLLMGLGLVGLAARRRSLLT